MSKDASSQLLENDQKEVLQEVANIGMGLAGEQLAKILGQFVSLSIPAIQVVSPATISSAVCEATNDKKTLTCIKQSFFSHWRGEAFTLFDQEGCTQLAGLLGYDNNLDRDNENELLLDIANVLTGACLNGLAEQLRVELNFSAPVVYAQDSHASQLFVNTTFHWSEAIIVGVHFNVERLTFAAHLLIMISESSVNNLRADLNAFIERL